MFLFFTLLVYQFTCLPIVLLKSVLIVCPVHLCVQRSLHSLWIFHSRPHELLTLLNLVLLPYFSCFWPRPESLLQFWVILKINTLNWLYAWAVCILCPSPDECSCQCAAKGRDEARDGARNMGIQYKAHRGIWEREMEDKKSGEGKRRQDEKVNGGWWRQLSETQ